MVSWEAHLLVCMLANLRAKNARVKCISFKVVQYSLWFLSECLVAYWDTNMPFVFSHVEYCDMHFIYGFCNGNSRASVEEYRRRFPIEEFRLDMYLLEFTRHCRTMVVFQVFQWTLKSRCQAVKISNFTGHYLRNRSTLDIGVLGVFGIVWHKEQPPEVWSVPPVTPCVYIYIYIYIYIFFYLDMFCTHKHSIKLCNNTSVI